MATFLNGLRKLHPKLPFAQNYVLTMFAFRRTLLTRPLRTPVVQPLRTRLPPRLVRFSSTLQDYHRVADETMDKLTAELENLLEENDIPGSDVEYSVDNPYFPLELIIQSGVLTLKLGKHGTYVINKQPPNQQIWLSSPTRYWSHTVYD